MHRSNFPGRKNKRRETALAYWKRQLNKETRSPHCEASDDTIKAQIKNLEAAILKGVA